MLSAHFDSEDIFIYPGENAIILFSSISSKFWVHLCVDRESNYSLFTNTSRRKFFSDCVHQLYNDSNGCIPLGRDIFELEFKHLSSGIYKICSNLTKFNKLSSAFILKTCKPKVRECLIKDFVTKVEVRFTLDHRRSTIYIMPIRYPHIKFIETLQMDFDKLIYDFGGIIGMWFGLSPAITAELILTLKKTC